MKEVEEILQTVADDLKEIRKRVKDQLALGFYRDSDKPYEYWIGYHCGINESINRMYETYRNHLKKLEDQYKEDDNEKSL